MRMWTLNVFKTDDKKKQQKWNAYNPWCSQAVTHRSSNHAQRCLTSVIGREPVFSTWFVMWRNLSIIFHVFDLLLYFYFIRSPKVGVICIVIIRYWTPAFNLCSCFLNRLYSSCASEPKSSILSRSRSIFRSPFNFLDSFEGTQLFKILVFRFLYL